MRRRRRRFSPQHETRWLNLLGFTLRPGMVSRSMFGASRKRGVDLMASSPSRGVVSHEWWILLATHRRRTDRGQQQALAGPLLPAIKETAKSAAKPRGEQAGPQEIAEQIRLIGACECYPPR